MLTCSNEHIYTMHNKMVVSVKLSTGFIVSNIFFYALTSFLFLNTYDISK